MSIRFLFCALSLLLVAGSHFLEAATEEKTGRIRVMTFNIHHARGMDDRVDLDRIAEVIRREKPDAVGLQEVDRGIARSGNRDLTAELAELTGMHGYFESNHPVGGGEYGNAWLTKFPILQKENLHYRHLHDGEQRGLLQLVVDVKGQKMLFLNTHLAHRDVDAEDREFSVQQAMELIQETYADLPVVFLGDFNARPGSPVYRKLDEQFEDVWEKGGEGDGFTFRSDRPEIRIDYIWIGRGSGLSVKRAWVPETLASDHLPIVAEIEIGGRE